VAAEQAQPSAFGFGGGDVERRSSARTQRLEVDRANQQVAQRVQVERVELRGREPVGPGQQGAPRGTEARWVARHVPQRRHALGHRAPEPLERGARAVGAVAAQTLGEQHRVHRAGTRAADGGDVHAAFEQRIEHTPGEGAMRTAALQRERERRRAKRGSHAHS
jgi:hypothetical protein